LGRPGRRSVAELSVPRFACYHRLPSWQHSKGQLLLPEAFPETKDYNQSVRYYTTKPLNGGIAFKCTICEFTVHTLDFDHTKGNRRTQAAAAVNNHVRELHPPRLRMDVPVRVAGRGY